MQLQHIEPIPHSSPPVQSNSEPILNVDDYVEDETQNLDQETSASSSQSELALEAARFKRRMVRSITAVGLFSVSMLVLKATLGKDTWNDFNPMHLAVSATLSVGLLTTLFIVSWGGHHRKRRRILAAKVANEHDARSIGPLVEAMQLDDAQTREIAVLALIDLLPTVSDADTDCITPTQRGKLNRILNTPVENPLHKDIRVLFRPAVDRVILFRVAILKAMTQLGDQQSLWIVRRLAESEPTTEGEKRIHEAALECLPILEARLDLLRTSRTLLRASAATTAYEATLLRADTRAAEQDPQEMLRAGE